MAIPFSIFAMKRKQSLSFVFLTPDEKWVNRCLPIFILNAVTKLKGLNSLPILQTQKRRIEKQGKGIGIVEAFH